MENVVRMGALLMLFGDPGFMKIEHDHSYKQEAWMNGVSRKGLEEEINKL